MIVYSPMGTGLLAIVGARRPAQTDGWLPAADVRLSAADLAEIERALEETGAGTDDPPTPPATQAPSANTSSRVL